MTVQEFIETWINLRFCHFFFCCIRGLKWDEHFSVNLISNYLSTWTSKIFIILMNVGVTQTDKQSKGLACFSCEYHTNCQSPTLHFLMFSFSIFTLNIVRCAHHVHVVNLSLFSLSSLTKSVSILNMVNEIHCQTLGLKYGSRTTWLALIPNIESCILNIGNLRIFWPT